MQPNLINLNALFILIEMLNLMKTNDSDLISSPFYLFIIAKFVSLSMFLFYDYKHMINKVESGSSVPVVELKFFMIWKRVDT
jgi:hypothetical protein